MAQATGARSYYVHGEDVEKRANGRALVEGRGRSTVCEARIPADVLRAVLRVDPRDLVRIQRTYAFGFARLGTHNHLVQSANGIAAVFLACGQDVAYVTESATGLLDFEVGEDGALYASAFLPSLLVGTVGGGSGQGTAAECLDLLGVRGTGGANAFAEILAATVLAGDLSLLASFCTHDSWAPTSAWGATVPPADPCPFLPTERATRAYRTAAVRPAPSDSRAGSGSPSPSWSLRGGLRVPRAASGRRRTGLGLPRGHPAARRRGRPLAPLRPGLERLAAPGPAPRAGAGARLPGGRALVLLLPAALPVVPRGAPDPPRVAAALPGRAHGAVGRRPAGFEPARARSVPPLRDRLRTSGGRDARPGARPRRRARWSRFLRPGPRQGASADA